MDTSRRFKPWLTSLLVVLLAGCTLPFGSPPTPTNAPTSASTAAPTAAPTAEATPVPIPTGPPIDISGQPTARPDTPTDAPTAAPAADSADDDLALIAANPRPARDMVALAQTLGECRTDPAACTPAPRTTPLEVQVGDVESFWLTNIETNRNFEIKARLSYAGPVVLMYVDEGTPVDEAALAQAARTFEEEIYPRTRALFGSEVQPGVDGDTRITIINGPSVGGGVIGYFSSSDSVPRSVNRFSNEREMFYMNIEWLDPADPSYLDTLAHEFQHMIHQNERSNSATWFNEGNSTLSEDLNGFVNHGFVALYLSEPDTQLNAWGNQPGASGGHYGAAHLFMRYIFTHYAGEEGLRELIRADAGNDLDAFVRLAVQTRPEISSFDNIFGDWMVANLLDNPDLDGGRYGYASGRIEADLLPATVEPERIRRSSGEQTVHQYGVDYLELPDNVNEVSFVGETIVGLVGDAPRGSHAWWSNRSDDSVATLTRPIDLRGVQGATLTFDTWYEIENDYDYAFVSVSTDGGKTWETLPGKHTTTDDPQGVNYGHGLTGVSGVPGGEPGEERRGRWVEEQMDLTPYAGKELLLRFWQITDMGFNAPGILIDNIRIPEIGFSDDVDSGAGEWQAEGFVRMDGLLPQRWILRLVRTAADGSVRVEALTPDAEGRATATLAEGERGVLVVAGATPYTTEVGGYTVTTQ